MAEGRASAAGDVRVQEVRDAAIVEHGDKSLPQRDQEDRDVVVMPVANPMARARSAMSGLPTVVASMRPGADLFLWVDTIRRDLRGQDATDAAATRARRNTPSIRDGKS